MGILGSRLTRSVLLGLWLCVSVSACRSHGSRGQASESTEASRFTARISALAGHPDVREPSGSDSALVGMSTATLGAATLGTEDAGTEDAGTEDAKKTGGGKDLAAAAQNPIANTISVPFENNFFFGVGPKEEVSWTLNFQPVIPFALTDSWNLINRPIVPILVVPGPVAGNPSIPGEPQGLPDTVGGLGDINYTGFLSPSDSGSIIWGAGPSITFPSATDDLLGSGLWSAGPSAVVLTIQKPWLFGMLVQHLWSFAGESGRGRVDRTMLQPFVNYNLDDGWYLTSSPIILADWSQSSDQRWTVPIGFGVGKLLKFGEQPVNTRLALYHNIEHAENAADWQLQFAIQFLFPK